jgi:hypothetical protein
MSDEGLTAIGIFFSGLTGLIFYYSEKQDDRFVTTCQSQGGDPLFVGRGGQLCVRDGFIIPTKQTEKPNDH